jgi:hypothetical protein
MAPKKPQTRLQKKADKAGRIVTGPKGSKPQSTTNAAIQKQGGKLTRGGLGSGRPSGTVSQARSKPVGTGGGGVTKPSGTAKMVNANKPTMQKLVRKAAQARKAASGRPLVKPVEAQRLMTQRAPGIRQGAAQLRQQAAGTTSPGAQARAAAQGKAARQAAETRRTARAASQRMAGKLAKAAATRLAGTVARRAGLAAVAAEGLTARNTADGTLSAAMKRGDYKPKQGPTPKTTTSSFNKKTFDQAFKAARTSGAKEFTWRGKRYNTKMK